MKFYYPKTEALLRKVGLLEALGHVVTQADGQVVIEPHAAQMAGNRETGPLARQRALKARYDAAREAESPRRAA